MSRRVAAQPAVTPEAVQRIAGAIREYEAQGFHRTGTAIDRMSGEWLAALVERAGPRATLEPFALRRVDPVVSTLTIAGRRIEGIPLFDGAFTTQPGISGRLGSEIAVVETAVNAAGAGALGDARRSGRYRAIVAITKGARPGLCPSNADDFLSPFGPPVLQVSSVEASWLAGHAAQGSSATVVAYVMRNQATAVNVVAEVPGTDPSRPPVVVMTPRSGWYRCGSERGGGIACWLEILRALAASQPSRTTMFVASSGHELGHLGIDAYIARREGIVKRAGAWLHLGANIGAATMLNNNLVQASDDEMDGVLTKGMIGAGLEIARRAPRGRVPAGEAEAVHHGGGRYASAIGGNALFHHPDDHGPAATDPAVIARFSAAFVDAVRAIMLTA